MSATALTLDDARAILAPLGLRPVALAAIEKGTVNSNFRVDSDGGPLFVRVNEGKREEDVQYEGALLWHLGARRLPTPQPLRMSSGRPYVAWKGRLVTVFPWQVGVEVHEGQISAVHAGRVGELLARLHRAALDFGRQRRGPYTFEHIVGRVAAFRGRAAEVADLAAALPVLDDEIAYLSRARPALAGLPMGTIHGDLFPDNLLWAGERIVAALDFEQASRGHLAYDLAVALLAHCFPSGVLVDGLAWSLVSGYQRVRALGDDERDALWIEARTAALRFTVTRVTDVLLPSLAPGAPQPRPGKDFRDFLARLIFLRERGPEVLMPVVGQRPPLRAV